MSSRSSVSHEAVLGTSEYRLMIQHLWQVHQQEYERYYTHPDSHPKYHAEWIEFIRTRSHSVIELGADPETYDFYTEWKSVWVTRLQELEVEEWNLRKQESLKESSTRVRCQREKRAAFNRQMREELLLSPVSSESSPSSPREERCRVKRKIRKLQPGSPGTYSEGVMRRSWTPVRKRARSPSVGKSRSPIIIGTSRSRFRSPVRIRSRSPIKIQFKRSFKIRSKNILRIQSKSPIRIRSKSPTRKIRSKSPIRIGSKSPIRIGTKSPIRIGSKSPIRIGTKSPIRIGSKSPIRIGSKSPIRIGSKSPIRIGPKSPIGIGSGSPIRIGSGSPIRIRSRSPMRIGSKSPMRIGSKSPIRTRSPVRLLWSPIRKRSSPARWSKSSLSKQSKSPTKVRSKGLLHTPVRLSSSPVLHPKSPPIRSISPRNRRSKSPRNRRSMSPRNRRSMSPRNRWSISPRNRWSISPRNRWSISPRNRWSISPRNRRSKSPRNRWSISPRNRRSISPRNRRSISPRNRWSISPRNRRSISPRNRSSMSPRNRRSMSPRNRRSMSPRNRRSMSPRNRRPMSPSNRRPMSPRNRRPMSPRNRRPMSPINRSTSPRHSRSTSPRYKSRSRSPASRPRRPKFRSRSSSRSRCRKHSCSKKHHKLGKYFASHHREEHNKPITTFHPCKHKHNKCSHDVDRTSRRKYQKHTSDKERNDREYEWITGGGKISMACVDELETPERCKNENPRQKSDDQVEKRSKSPIVVNCYSNSSSSSPKPQSEDMIICSQVPVDKRKNDDSSGAEVKKDGFESSCEIMEMICEESKAKNEDPVSDLPISSLPITVHNLFCEGISKIKMKKNDIKQESKSCKEESKPKCETPEKNCRYFPITENISSPESSKDFKCKYSELSKENAPSNKGKAVLVKSEKENRTKRAESGNEATSRETPRKKGKMKKERNCSKRKRKRCRKSGERLSEHTIPGGKSKVDSKGVIPGDTRCDTHRHRDCRYDSKENVKRRDAKYSQGRRNKGVKEQTLNHRGKPRFAGFPEYWKKEEGKEEGLLINNKDQSSDGKQKDTDSVTTQLNELQKAFKKAGFPNFGKNTSHNLCTQQESKQNRSNSKPAKLLSETKPYDLSEVQEEDSVSLGDKAEPSPGCSKAGLRKEIGQNPFDTKEFENISTSNIITWLESPVQISKRDDDNSENSNQDSVDCRYDEREEDLSILKELEETGEDILLSNNIEGTSTKGDSSVSDPCLSIELNLKRSSSTSGETQILLPVGLQRKDARIHVSEAGYASFDEQDMEDMIHHVKDFDWSQLNDDMDMDLQSSGSKSGIASTDSTSTNLDIEKYLEEVTNDSSESSIDWSLDSGTQVSNDQIINTLHLLSESAGTLGSLEQEISCLYNTAREMMTQDLNLKQCLLRPDTRELLMEAYNCLKATVEVGGLHMVKEAIYMELMEMIQKILE